MTEDEAIRITRGYIETQFPRSCSNCGREFRNLREYLENTTHLDTPVLYHETGENHSHELGPMSFANCRRCGTTLTIGSRNMPRKQMADLMRWARREASRRAIGLRELLTYVRDRIDEQVLRGS
jgi:hypothetical protein